MTGIGIGIGVARGSRSNGSVIEGMPGLLLNSDSEFDPRVVDGDNLVTPPDDALPDVILGDKNQRTIPLSSFTGSERLWIPDSPNAPVYKIGIAKSGKPGLRYADGTRRCYENQYSVPGSANFLHNNTGCVVGLAFKPTSAVVVTSGLIDTGGGSTANVGILLAYNGTTAKIELYVARGVPGVPAIISMDCGPIVANQRIAVVYRQQPTSPNNQVWINGVSTFSADFAAAPSSANATGILHLGSTSYTPRMDLYQCSIFNRTLTDSQCVALGMALVSKWV